MSQLQLIKPDEVNNDPYIFVSYSRKDMEEVQDVLKILRKNHFRFWYDMGLKSGTEWAEELGEKIDRCDQFLVILSPNAVESKYVRKEISLAIATKSAGRILVLYLHETELTLGLQLLLNDIHAIYKKTLTEKHDFEQAICKAASRNTLMSSSVSEICGEAKSEFLQNYELLNMIGQGGIASVYLARHKRTGAIVAVKHGIIDNTYRGSVTLECFYTERHILVRTMNNKCPYVPVVIDWFQDTDNVYLVETFFNGKTFKDTEAYYSEEQVVSIIKKVLKILQQMHSRGVIYRDIKPSNLIEDEFGNIFLIDFNTAREIGETFASEKALGTVGYAPPEQFCEDEKTHTSYASDIYALGRTIEYLLCQNEFDRNGKAPLRYFRKDISVEFEKIIGKMTDSVQMNRYQTVDEVLKVLENYKTRNVFKKLFLVMCSEMKIKKYVEDRKKNEKIRKLDLEEIISFKEQVGDSSYSTEILSDFVENDKTFITL